MRWFPTDPWSTDGVAVPQWGVTGAHGHARRALPGPPEAPTELDISLIRVLCAAMAEDAACGRCGAPLGGRLRIERPLGPSPFAGWYLGVLVRCRGWRRHRHLATVTSRSGDLVLRHFRPT